MVALQPAWSIHASWPVNQATTGVFLSPAQARAVHLGRQVLNLLETSRFARHRLLDRVLMAGRLHLSQRSIVHAHPGDNGTTGNCLVKTSAIMM